ncbi:MAG: divalent metal ion transporter [Ignavibacteria bacterium RBG_13_36_8]|nr:MAG: divalent metal ion transporter [Ignavibacteria bacterium RBG_13_36_8]
MLKKYLLTGEKIIETSDENASILVYISPDEAEKKYLIDELKLDEHTLASSLDPDELSRLEFEPNHVAMIYKRPENLIDKDQLLFKVTSAGIYLFNDKIIIVMNEDISIFDTKIFSKVMSMQHLALKLILRSITHFLGHLKAINFISDELEKKINESMENKYLINLFTLEKSLVYYLNAINSNSSLMERLKNNAAKIGFTPLELELLDDIYIENNQCYKQAEIYSNILASMMDARASIVSNNLNILMKTLNIITIGIMVPTFVVSAFSMNVSIPLQSHPFAFWIVMFFATISVMGFLFFWKRRKW